MPKGQPISSHITTGGKEPEINKFFKIAIKLDASDIHLKVGQTARLRISGDLKSTTGEVFTDEKLKTIVFEILSPLQREQFIEQGTLDFSYEYSEDQRFRVNVFMQKGHVSLVARRAWRHR